MNWYSIALFAHIVGVLTLFITQALQWLVTLRLRRAQTLAQAREWLGLVRGVNRLTPVTLVLIIGAGVYMAMVGQLFTAPWLDVSLGAIAIMMALGMGVVGWRMGAVRRAVAGATSEGALSPEMQARIADPALWVAAQTPVAVALSIVYLMTTKPDLLGAIVAVVVALALGVGVGAMTRRSQQAEPQVARIGVR
jgi:hypothetical protein